LIDLEHHLDGVLVFRAHADLEHERSLSQERLATVIRTADPDCDPKEREILAREGYESMLMLPLVSRGETIGLITFLWASCLGGSMAMNIGSWKSSSLSKIEMLPSEENTAWLVSTAMMSW